MGTNQKMDRSRVDGSYAVVGWRLCRQIEVWSMNWGMATNPSRVDEWIKEWEEKRRWIEVGMSDGPYVVVGWRLCRPIKVVGPMNREMATMDRSRVDGSRNNDQVKSDERERSGHSDGSTMKLRWMRDKGRLDGSRTEIQKAKATSKRGVVQSKMITRLEN